MFLSQDYLLISKGKEQVRVAELQDIAEGFDSMHPDERMSPIPVIFGYSDDMTVRFCELHDCNRSSLNQDSSYYVLPCSLCLIRWPCALHKDIEAYGRS